MSDKRFSVIIPSYNPDEKLLCVVTGLEELGVDDIIVVNDGSKEECIRYFDEVSERPSVTLITHEKNRGKGAALKTAFKYFLENRKDSAGCVTADGDAQHKPCDIVKCANDMITQKNSIILGVRDFSKPDVPARSRTGNRITSAVFRIFVGMKISDTQTGLRAFPMSCIKDMCEISGDRYEYETNMLLEIKKRGIPFSETIIETVYIEENRTSHFNPIKDSWRIYKLILAHFFKYTLSSVFCFILEQIIQSTVFHFVKNNVLGVLSELIAFLPARIISSVANFALNRKFVFGSDTNMRTALIRYYILWFLQAIATILLDLLFTQVLFRVSSDILYTVITVCVKTAIAIVSFRIQKDWVFAEKKHDNKKQGE